MYYILLVCKTFRPYYTNITHDRFAIIKKYFQPSKQAHFKNMTKYFYCCTSSAAEIRFCSSFSTIIHSYIEFIIFSLIVGSGVQYVHFCTAHVIILQDRVLNSKNFIIYIGRHYCSVMKFLCRVNILLQQQYEKFHIMRHYCYIVVIFLTISKLLNTLSYVVTLRCFRQYWGLDTSIVKYRNKQVIPYYPLLITFFFRKLPSKVVLRLF